MEVSRKAVRRVCRERNLSLPYAKYKGGTNEMFTALLDKMQKQYRSSMTGWVNIWKKENRGNVSKFW